MICRLREVKFWLSFVTTAKNYGTQIYRNRGGIKLGPLSSKEDNDCPEKQNVGHMCDGQRTNACEFNRNKANDLMIPRNGLIQSKTILVDVMWEIAWAGYIWSNVAGRYVPN